MSDASSPPVDDLWANASTAAAAAAAAARTESTRRRLAELQQRMDRLRAGQPSTRDDVARARAAVTAQRHAYTVAQRRMLSARCTPRQRSIAASGEAVGEPDRYESLREAFVALASAHLADTGGQSDHDRRRQLAAALVDQAARPVGGWTQALCQLALSVLPAVIGSAVSAYDERGVAHPFAAADDRSMALEELQQVAGEGPGCAVHISGVPVVVDDLSRQDTRWPGYVSAVRGQGIAVVWSLPVVVDATRLGSLTLYQDSGHAPPGRSAWSDAATLAGLAAATMIVDADLRGDRHLDERTPADAVSLASGMLAVRAGVAVDQALALLRGHAFSSGRRISDIAADVLAGTIDLG